MHTCKHRAAPYESMFGEKSVIFKFESIEKKQHKKFF